MKSDFHFPGIDRQSKSNVVSQNKDDALIQRCYALVPKGEISPKLSLIFRNGNRCTVPYAYIIRSIYDVKGILALFTTDIEIQITGRGLDKIDAWLAVNQVMWIKQHAVTIDPQTDKVFITNIEIKDRK